MKKHALIIEEYACWGCMACETACKQEYNPVNAAHAVKYRRSGEMAQSS